MYNPLEIANTKPLALVPERGTSLLGLPENGAATATVTEAQEALSASDEMLIIDGRANLGPAELVEHKLGNLLRSGAVPVSHFRVLPLQGRRRSF